MPATASSPARSGQWPADIASPRRARSAQADHRHQRGAVPDRPATGLPALLKASSPVQGRRVAADEVNVSRHRPILAGRGRGESGVGRGQQVETRPRCAALTVTTTYADPAARSFGSFDVGGVRVHHQQRVELFTFHLFTVQADDEVELRRPSRRGPQHQPVISAPPPPRPAPRTSSTPRLSDRTPPSRVPA